jgi:hypothetical protein
VATVIDSLIVQLGLDPKGFKKGADEVEKQSKKTKDSVKKDAGEIADGTAKTEFAVKKSSDSMVSSFRRVATEVIGLFVAVRSVQDVVGFFERVNASTRQLGLDSKNFGIAANELRDWQNAAVLAGGSAQGVTDTIANLNKSLFNLQYTGQVSDQLIYLQRLGVQFRTVTGQVAPFKNILMQTAQILERNGRSRAENFQYLQAAGFDVGSINLVLAGTKALAAYYEQQKKLPQLNDADAASALHLSQAWELLTQKVTVGAQKLLTRLDASGVFDEIFAGLDKLITLVDSHQDDIVDFFKGAVAWVQGPGGPLIKAFFTDLATDISTLAAAVRDVAAAFQWLEDKGDTLGGAVFKAIHERADVDRYGNRLDTRGVRNNNPGNLKTTGDLGRDPEGFAVYSSLEKGRAALDAQLALDFGRGRNTIASLITKYEGADVPGNRNNVPAYIAAVAAQTGIAPNAPLSQSDLAAVANAIAAHENGVVASPAARRARTASGSQFFGPGMEDYWQKVSEDRKGVFAPNPGASIFSPNPSALSAAQGAQPSPIVQASQSPIASTAGPSNQVQIDSIQINTSASDADSIFAQTARAVQRKLNVAQFEPGLA